jgi:hypothetical protein
MKDLGVYKTVKQETYRCHFDPEANAALALGPLPSVGEAFRVDAQSEGEAKQKLAAEIGNGIMVEAAEAAQ